VRIVAYQSDIGDHASAVMGAYQSDYILGGKNVSRDTGKYFLVHGCL